MHAITIVVGEYFIFLSVLATIVFWLVAKTPRKVDLAWRVVVAGLISEILAQIAGRAYYDPRPFVTQHLTPLIAHARDNGFPSDHVLLAATLAFVVLHYSRRIGALLLLLALLIGWARVHAAIHRPIDVLGAVVFAALAVSAVQFGSWIIHAWRHHPDPAPSID